MAAFDDLTRSVTCRYNDLIKNACMPLLEYFNLSLFSYFKIKNSGSYTFLGSHAAWSEYFAAEKLYFNFPYYRHPMYTREGIFTLMNIVQNDDLSPILNLGKEKFNIHHRLILIKQIPNGIEGYCFATNSPNVMQIRMLLNEIPLLWLFIDHFKKKQRFLFSSLEDNQIDLSDLMGDTFFVNSLGIMPRSPSRDKLLQKLGISDQTEFNPREKRLLKLMLQGYSAGKIAPQIFLSKRTVEHQIERVKEKLGCDSKAELIQKAKELELFGCLTYLEQTAWHKHVS